MNKSNIIPNCARYSILALIFTTTVSIDGYAQVTDLSLLDAEERNTMLIEAARSTLLTYADKEYYTCAGEILIDDIASCDLMGNGVSDHYYSVTYLYNPDVLLMNMPYLAMVYFRSEGCVPVLIEYGTGFAAYLPYISAQGTKYAWWTLDGWLRQHYGMVNRPEMGEASIRRLREELSEQQSKLRSDAIASIKIKQ